VKTSSGIEQEFASENGGKPLLSNGLRSAARKSTVLLPLVIIAVSAGASIALQQYFRKDIPRTGREQRLMIVLDAPYGSVYLRPGTQNGVVATAESDDDESEAQSLHLHYGIRNQTIGILQIGVGTDEGMLNPNELAGVWRAGNGLSLASASAEPQSDMGRPAPVYAVPNGSPRTLSPDAPRPIPPLATPFHPRFYQVISTDAGTFIRPVAERASQTRLFVTREIPATLQADLGFGEAVLDVSGLPLLGATIETGASRATVVSNAPNPQAMSVCQVNAGIGECQINGISNFNATKFVFNGGVGSYSLNFGGRLSRNLEAFISVGLGRCQITIPPEAGRVQVFYDDGLLSSFNFSGLTKRREGYATSVGFDQSTRPILTLRLSSGFGKMSVSYH
jgi:hypothetical protein